MGVHIELCVQIDAAPASVWDVVDDIPSHGTWMRDAVEITTLSTQRSGIGAEFSCLTKVGPLRERDLMRVVEWRPGSAMGIEHLGAVKGTARFTLTPDGGGTRFCWTEHLRFPWWMGSNIGERVAKPILGRVWRGNLERLKRAVEDGDPG